MVEKLVAALLVFLVTPGLTELLDDALHVIETGHSEHAEAHEQHGGAGAEHGCSGTFHTCPCHQSPSFLPASEALVVAASVDTSLGAPLRLTDRPADGVRRSLRRPPRA